MRVAKERALGLCIPPVGRMDYTSRIRLSDAIKEAQHAASWQQQLEVSRDSMHCNSMHSCGNSTVCSTVNFKSAFVRVVDKARLASYVQCHTKCD